MSSKSVPSLRIVERFALSGGGGLFGVLTDSSRGDFDSGDGAHPAPNKPNKASPRTHRPTIPKGYLNPRAPRNALTRRPVDPRRG